MASLNIKDITPEWTLFLDRDGVINKRIIDGYVTCPDEFVFIDGAPEAIAQLSSLFRSVFVVTNQQGIGKGLYSESDLHAVHGKMLSGIQNAGGKIAAIYFAPQLSSENSPMRKPGIGMALKARDQFPFVDFSRSIMVGDSSSDIEFALNAGMKSVYCGSKQHEKADMNFNSLTEFASYLAKHLGR